MAKEQTSDSDPAADAAQAAPGDKPKGKSRKKLLLIGLVVLCLGGAGIAYATGVAGKLTQGGGHGAPAHGSEKPAGEAAATGSVELPEIMANLNAGPRRTAYVRLKARLELSRKSDQAAVIAAQPKIQDLFQTYLRDMRPDELRGSTGSYRLREELMARANIAVAPAKVTEILFIEMLVQ